MKNHIWYTRADNKPVCSKVGGDDLEQVIAVVVAMRKIMWDGGGRLYKRVWITGSEVDPGVMGAFPLSKETEYE